MEAYELILKTRPNMYSQEWYDQSKEWLERAIEIAPDYARARSEYAWFRLMGWIFRFDTSPAPSAQILDNAIKAVQLDPSDAYGHRTAAFGYFFGKQLDAFEKEAERALELAPYNAEIFTQLGMLFAFTGQWDKGVALVTKANAINPISAQGWYHSALHYDYYQKREYHKALEIILWHPSTALCETQYKFVAAYGQLLQPEKAKPHWENCRSDESGHVSRLCGRRSKALELSRVIHRTLHGRLSKKPAILVAPTPCGLKHAEAVNQ